MTLLPRRVSTVIRTYGEPFSVGVQTRRGVFAAMQTGQLSRIFPRPVIDGFARPVWSVVVSAADPTVVGDTALWRGSTFTVRAALDHALRGVIVARELVMEPV